jgi:hypothetical protein
MHERYTSRYNFRKRTGILGKRVTLLRMKLRRTREFPHSAATVILRELLHAESPSTRLVPRHQKASVSSSKGKSFKRCDSFAPHKALIEKGFLILRTHLC